MSLNALTLNRMLASSNYGQLLSRGDNNNNAQQQPVSQNSLLMCHFGGYGALSGNILGSQQQPTDSMFGLGLGVSAAPPMSNISSNLFDVPDDEEDEEEDVPMQGFGNQLASSRHNNNH